MAKYHVKTEDGTFEVEVADDTPSAPEETFNSQLWNGSNASQALGRIPGAMMDVVNAGNEIAYHPIDSASKIYHSLVDNPGEAVGDIATGLTGMVPGLNTGLQATADSIYGIPRSGAEYGKMLNQDVVGGSAGLALGAGIGKIAESAGMAGSSSLARNAAREAAFADPATQAGVRTAQSLRLLDTEAAQKALANGQLDHPEITNGVSQAQQVMQQVARPLDPYAPDAPTRDYLGAIATGAPEGTAVKAQAHANAAAEAFPTVSNSGVLTSEGRIDPYTATYPQSSNAAPLPDYVVANRLSQGSIDVLATRKTVVNTLDQAMNVINQQSPGMPKVRGINFTSDMAPNLEELRAIIDKRKMLIETQPISDQMKASYNNVESSFNSIQNTSTMNRWQKIGPDGSLENGELSPSQTLSMIENMNAFRMSLGEFDESARVSGLNGNFSDFNQRAAELYSLGEVQKSAQAALEAKTGEILSLSPNIKGYYPFQEELSKIRPDTLAKMNQFVHHGLMMKERLDHYSNATMQAFTGEAPKRMSTTLQQGQQDFQGPMTEAKQGMLNYIGQKTGLAKPPINMAQARMQRALERQNAVSSQMIDGLLIRDKRIPILSRDWENIKIDPDSMNELAMRATAVGLTAPGQFESLPEPSQKQIHETLVGAFSAGFAAVPGNYSIANGMFLNPMEKDSYIRDALKGGAADRALKVGNAMSNKYVAPPASTPPPTAPQALPATIANLNESLGNVEASVASPSPMDSPLDSLVTPISDLYN